MKLRINLVFALAAGYDKLSRKGIYLVLEEQKKYA